MRFPYIDLLRTQEGTQAQSRATTQQGGVSVHNSSVSTEEEIKDFYSDLEDAYSKCGSHDIVIVMGDMNAKVEVNRIH